MAARRPAPPPPTMTTSCEVVMARLAPVVRAELLLHLVPVVADRPRSHAAVVVLMADLAASALVVLAVDDQSLVVAVFDVVAVDDLSAGCLLSREPRPVANHHLLLKVDGWAFAAAGCDHVVR